MCPVTKMLSLLNRYAEEWTKQIFTVLLSLLTSSGWQCQVTRVLFIYSASEFGLSGRTHQYIPVLLKVQQWFTRTLHLPWILLFLLVLVPILVHHCLLWKVREIFPEVISDVKLGNWNDYQKINMFWWLTCQFITILRLFIFYTSLFLFLCYAEKRIT